MPQSSISRERWNIAAKPWLLLPVAALAAITPLLLHGVSCGQDLGFHIVSWLEAARQLRHGHYPHWAVSPAWNAGEPRFLFYPPLSWLLGAALTTFLPVSFAPIAFVFLVLAAAGLSLYRLAAQFVSQEAALVASAFYIGNPYMLFNVFERSAVAELMAAVWIPLLLLAVLRTRPTVHGIAVPLALLWLTNAPAAVMSSYMLALVAALRVAIKLWNATRSEPIAWRDLLRFALTFVTGTALGLALPAFYLVPAAYERRFVQMEMAIIPNMRVQDNFLFDRTADAAHNAVNHTASVLALTVLALTVAAVSGSYLRMSRRSTQQSRSTEAPKTSIVVTLLATLTVVISFLLVPVSTPLWLHLPELAFLQFPWRLLSILSVVLAFSLALLLGTVRLPPIARFIVPFLTLILSFAAYGLYAQHCEPTDTPAAIANLLATHHGIAPTDEYTPTDADNDVLRTGDSGYWLAQTADAPTPHSVPTAAELNPAIGSDDTPVPLKQTLSSPAPHDLRFHADGPGFLILNLRDYPNWVVGSADANSMSLYHPKHIPRADGLIAIPLYYASDFWITVEWRRTTDQWIGIVISIMALLLLLFRWSLQHRRSAQPVKHLA